MFLCNLCNWVNIIHHLVNFVCYWVGCSLPSTCHQVSIVTACAVTLKYIWLWYTLPWKSPSLRLWVFKGCTKQSGIKFYSSSISHFASIGTHFCEKHFLIKVLQLLKKVVIIYKTFSNVEPESEYLFNSDVFVQSSKTEAFHQLTELLPAGIYMYAAEMCHFSFRRWRSFVIWMCIHKLHLCECLIWR